MTRQELLSEVYKIIRIKESLAGTYSIEGIKTGNMDQAKKYIANYEGAKEIYDYIVAIVPNEVITEPSDAVEPQKAAAN